MDAKNKYSLRADEVFEGAAMHQGGTTPTSDPHVCAYLRLGAHKAQCLELTTVYNRNLAGCCGTNDHRAFPPCNFQWRKCRECLAEGRGSRSGPVVDVPRGLCEEHERKAQRLDTPAPAIPALTPPRKGVKRLVITAPQLPPKKPATVSRPVRSYEPPGAKRTPEPPQPAEKPIRTVAVEMSKKPSISATVSVPQLPDGTLDVCVGKFCALTQHNQEALRCLARGEPVPSWGASSYKSKKSDLLTTIGIPHGRNRLAYLRQVLERLETCPPTNEAPPLKDESPEKRGKAQILIDDFDLEKSLKRFRGFSDKAKKLTRVLVNGESIPGRSVASTASAKSTLCNNAGIPKESWNGCLNIRMDLLRQVVERYDELEAISLTRRAVEEPPKEREIRLLTHFRLLPELEQCQVEELLRALVNIEKQKQAGG